MNQEEADQDVADEVSEEDAQRKERLVIFKEQRVGGHTMSNDILTVCRAVSSSLSEWQWLGELSGSRSWC